MHHRLIGIGVWNKPLLLSSGEYISWELGPMAQNLFFALYTPIIGNKKVIFPFPSDCERSVLFVKTERGRAV